MRVARTAPARIHRATLPEMTALLGMSTRSAERELERERDGGAYVDLTYADTKRFPPPVGVLERIVRASVKDGETYTPYRGDPRVRQAVAGNLSDFLGIELDPGHDLILTPGSQSAMFCALSSLVDAGDRVVLMDPDYLSSERMLRYLGAEVIRVPLHWSSGFAVPDLPALEQAIGQRPSVLLFSNPNNPVGATYELTMLEKLAGLLAASPDTVVVVDELYSRLIYDDEALPHFAALPGMRERTVTLLGPSKSESMSGYRLGVAVASAPLVDDMEDVLSLTGLRAPAYAQHGLLGWLRDDVEFMRARIEDYRVLRDAGVQRLNDSGLFEVVAPRGTAYMFPRFRFTATDQVVASALQREARLIVNPGYQSGTGGIGHMRLCFAQRTDVWEQSLTAIVEVAEGLCRRG
jgi:aspartate/methionine/tyrosine aminotransferase